MNKYIKILLTLLIGILFTLISLIYETSYELCLQVYCEIRPAWGFPVQYFYDNEVTSPVLSLNIEDTFKIFQFILNVIFYSIISTGIWKLLKGKSSANKV